MQRETSPHVVYPQGGLNLDRSALDLVKRKTEYLSKELAPLVGAKVVRWRLRPWVVVVRFDEGFDSGTGVRHGLIAVGQVWQACCSTLPFWSDKADSHSFATHPAPCTRARSFLDELHTCWVGGLYRPPRRSCLKETSSRKASGLPCLRGSQMDAAPSSSTLLILAPRIEE